MRIERKGLPLQFAIRNSQFAMHDRIYLVGFMGSGKTEVGPRLADRLGLEFVDLDAEIERAEGMTIREIFEKSGEPYFRALERKHLQAVACRPPVVVALGGGAYIDSENRALAERTGVTVWLKVSFDNVVHRVKMDGARPLFASLEQSRRLYDSRVPIYELARIHIPTDDRTPDAIVDDIVRRLEEL